MTVDEIEWLPIAPSPTLPSSEELAAAAEARMFETFRIPAELLNGPAGSGALAAAKAHESVRSWLSRRLDSKG